MGKRVKFIMESPHFTTLHRSETSSIAERDVRGVKEGTSAVLLRSGLDDKWWSDFMEFYCYLRKRPRPPGRWRRRHMKDDLENFSEDQ